MKVDLIIIYKSRFLNSCLAKKEDWLFKYPFSSIYNGIVGMFVSYQSSSFISRAAYRNTHTVIRIYCKNNFFEIEGYFLEKQIHEVKSQNLLFYGHFIFMILYYV